MLLQRSLIFRSKRLPMKHQFKSEYALNEHFFEFCIDKHNYLINTVHIPAKESKGVVFFLHGTLQHIQYHIPKANIFLENNYDVVMMDYPKYGKSKGRLTEDLLHEVVHLTFQQSMNTIKNNGKVILAGRSLGTALASNLATKTETDKLILISPYYSMPDLFNHKVKVFPFKKLKFKFENHTYLPNVKGDAYIIHGNEDKLIPIVLAQKLLPYLKSEQHFIEIANANHFNIHEKDEFKEFIKSILQ